MEDEFIKEKLAKWLSEKWVGGIACPVCKENDWGLYDQIWELRKFQKGDVALGGPIIPLVVITCNNCGHTMHFSALKIGLTETEDSHQPKK
jgi:hypothetical protein